MLSHHFGKYQGSLNVYCNGGRGGNVYVFGFNFAWLWSDWFRSCDLGCGNIAYVDSRSYRPRADAWFFLWTSDFKINYSGVTMQLKDKLWRLRKTCLKVAQADTSCYPSEYKRAKESGELKSPLRGHCAAVATMIRGMFGGDVVQGRVNEESHYWNRLPDGIEIDLTSCQFGGDGLTPFKKGRKVPVRERTNPRFLVFAARVLAELKR
jgi:hypothetical protein